MAGIHDTQPMTEVEVAAARHRWTSQPDPDGDYLEVFSTQSPDPLRKQDERYDDYPLALEVSDGQAAVAIHADDLHAFAAALLQVDPSRVVVLPEVEVDRRVDGDIYLSDKGVDGAVANSGVTPKYMLSLIAMAERTLATRRAVLALLLEEASRG